MPGGRPRKYHSIEARNEARRVQNREHVRSFRCRKSSALQHSYAKQKTTFILMEPAQNLPGSHKRQILPLSIKEDVTLSDNTSPSLLDHDSFPLNSADASANSANTPFALTDTSYYSVATSVSLLHSPSLYLLNSNPEELCSLQYFCSKTLADFCYFPSDFWERSVLQAYHREPSIKHAILALASVHAAATFDVDLSPSSRPNVTQSYRQSSQGNLTCWGIFQYNKAIKYMQHDHMMKKRTPMSPRSREVLLICCIIFVCLESMLDEKCAIEHIQSGIRLFLDNRNNRMRQAGGYTTEDELLVILTRFDLQGTCWILERRPQLVQLSSTITLDEQMITTKTSLLPAIPATFLTLYEARASFERFFSIHLSLLGPQSASLQWIEVQKPLNSHTLGLSLEWLHTWEAAFHALLASLERTAPLTSREQHGVMTLQLYSTIGKGMATTGNSTNLLPSSFDWELRQRVEDCRYLIDEMISVGAKVGIDMGCIPPLYYIAMSAHDPAIREEALELLESYSWRDCFWESGFAAALVRNFKGTPIALQTQLAE